MKKSFLFALILSFFGGFTVEAKTAQMDNFCYVPPIIGSQIVSPNIMFVMDYSGSMGWCAYNPTSSKQNCCDDSNGCGWTYKGDEEGYFDPSKLYEYNSSQGYWQEAGSGSASQCPKRASGISTSNKYMGSCLNFIYMRRVDLVRWAITGGKPNSCDNQQIQKCDPEVYGQPSANLTCDSYGCILYSESSQKVRVPWSRVNDGLAFQFKQLSPRPRIGALLYRGTSIFDRVYIGDFTASANFDGVNPYKNFITAVNYNSASGATPTAPALWDAYNYFAQKSKEYGGLDPQSGEGDKWKNPMYQCFDDDGNGNCEGNELKNVRCAKNFVILLTDGQWNRGGSPVNSTCSIDTGYENHSADPVVPAYKMHKVGFTNAKTNVYSYVEALYGIGLWLGGTGEQSLKNVAMYGSFNRNSGGTWPDSLSGYPLNTCNMDDCGSGKGSACTALPASSSDWDQNGDGKPDTFFAASNALEIKNAIRTAVLEMMERISSGTTVAAIPSTSSSEASLVVRTFFYPKVMVGPNKDIEIRWIGALQGLWLDSEGNTRENSDTQGESNTKKELDILKDYPLVFVWDASDNAYVGRAYNTLDSNGKVTSCTSFYGRKLFDLKDLAGSVKPVFDAASTLYTRDPDNRAIKTYIGDATSSINTDWTSLPDFNTSAVSSLKNFWDYNDLGSCNDACAESVIKYVRGYDKPTTSGESFRLRQENSGTNIKQTWKLGDTFYSTPRIILNNKVNGYDTKYNDVSYSNFIKNTITSQKPILVMGANDGMIHGFRLEKMEDILPPTTNNNGKQVFKIEDKEVVGKEEWAFIPQNVLPYLRWYCQEGYCHIPMLETTFTILDASIGGNPDQGSAQSKDWRRLLIAQMGFGGTPITITDLKTFSSSIVVMDITNHMEPKLLWEQTLPDGSLTFSTPGIVRLGEKDKNGSWYLVIGSGPTSLTSSNITYPSTPKLYVYDLKTGEKKAELAIPNASNVAVGDFLSTDMDLPAADYQVDDLYFGTYNDTSGGLYRLRIRNGSSYYTNPVNWVASQIINAGKPIFAAPIVTHDDRYVRWLYVGTGIYINNNHVAKTNEKLYGLIEKDECWKGDGTCNTILENNLLNVTSLQFSGAKATKYSCQCLGGITISSGSCTKDTNANVTCPSCGTDEIQQVITDVEGATLTGASGSLASCNNKEEKAALKCIENNILYYNDTLGKVVFLKDGWFRDLTGEKVYSSPRVVGGAVLVTPFEPSSEPCEAGGSAKLIAVYYTTGTSYYQPLIRTQGGTTYTQFNDVAIQVEVKIAEGPPPTKESVVLREQEGKITAYTQASGGIIQTEIREPNPTKNQFIQWLTK